MTLPLKTQKCHKLLIVMGCNTDCVQKGQMKHSTCQINLIKHYLLQSSGFDDISFLPSIPYMILEISGLADLALFLVFHLPFQINVLLNLRPFLGTVKSLLERDKKCRVSVEPLQFCFLRDTSGWRHSSTQECCCEKSDFFYLSSYLFCIASH
jgi:hypothetical protein